MRAGIVAIKLVCSNLFKRCNERWYSGSQPRVLEPLQALLNIVVAAIVALAPRPRFLHQQLHAALSERVVVGAAGAPLCATTTTSPVSSSILLSASVL